MFSNSRTPFWLLDQCSPYKYLTRFSNAPTMSELTRPRKSRLAVACAWLLNEYRIDSVTRVGLDSEGGGREAELEPSCVRAGGLNDQVVTSVLNRGVEEATA